MHAAHPHALRTAEWTCHQGSAWGVLQVAGLTVSAEFNGHFQRLFTIFMTQLQSILAPSIDISAAYDNGSDEEQAFIQNLALFFTAFFRVPAPSPSPSPSPALVSRHLLKAMIICDQASTSADHSCRRHCRAWTSCSHCVLGVGSAQSRCRWTGDGKQHPRP